MEHITFLDYKKVEVKVGTIVSAERVPKTDKLLHLKVSFGDDVTKDVVTNLGSHYQPEQLANVKTMFVTNLEPATVRGILSEAMIFATTLSDGAPFIVKIDEQIKDGTKVG